MTGVEDRSVFGCSKVVRGQRGKRVGKLAEWHCVRLRTTSWHLQGGCIVLHFP